MDISINKRLFLMIMLTLSCLLLVNISNAQTNTSNGRSAGSKVDVGAYDDMNKIRILIGKGNFKDAARRSERFIKSEESGRKNGLAKSVYYKEAYNSLCVSYTGLGRLKDAIEACNASIELSPNHWESFKSRAMVYFMAQMYPGSLLDFENSLKYAPDNKGIKDALEQNISIVKSKGTSN